MYVRESFAAHVIPVFTYYQMLQSEPSVGGTEQARDLSNMRNPATMKAYWADYSLLLRRVAAAAGSRLVVIHVEPDLWGYLEQAHAVGLARSFAHRLIAFAQSVGATRAARVSPERVGHRRGHHEQQAVARPDGRAGGEVGRVLRVAPRPLRSRVQRRHRPRRGLLPVRRGQPAHLVGAGRLRPREPLHRGLHAAHPHARRALAVAARRHPREQHTGTTTRTTACSGGSAPGPRRPRTCARRATPA